MIEKSELDYLLEAADTTVNAVQLRAVVRRAIELRKQDLAADNTPKGGGDVKDLCVKERITSYLGLGGLFNPELANHEAVRDLLIDCRDTYDALLAERDAARAELKEAEKVAELSSRIDIAWGNDEDEENDDVEFIELMTELRKVLRPWRVKRLGNEQLAQHEADLDRVGKQP